MFFPRTTNRKHRQHATARAVTLEKYLLTRRDDVINAVTMTTDTAVLIFICLPILICTIVALPWSDALGLGRRR